MKTMEKLIRRFNRNNGRGCTAQLDYWKSEQGQYYVDVCHPEGYWAEYHFNCAGDFKDWMDGVVLD